MIALWCTTLAAPATNAADDTRVLGTFQTDEALQVNLLAGALEQGRFAFAYGTYPHLYFNAALVPLTALAAARPVRERDIALALRAVSVAFGAATMLLVFAWARRRYGSPTAWLSLVVLALNPMFYGWAALAHPDVTQAFFLMLALYLLGRFVDQPSTGGWLAVSVVAGLAFATKYGGLPLLPLIWCAAARAVYTGRRAPRPLGARPFRLAAAAIAVALIGASPWLDAGFIAAQLTSDGQLDLPSPERTISLVRHAAQILGGVLAVVASWPAPWTALGRAPRLRCVMQDGVVSILVFGAAFTLVSPYSWARLAFVKGLVYHTVHGGLVEPVASSNWLSFVADETGVWVLIAAAATAAWVAARLVRGRAVSGSDAVLVAWNVMFVAVLFLPVHGVARHYVLPLIAPMILLACSGVARAAAAVATRRPSPVLRWAGAAVAIVVLIVAESAMAVRLTAERRATLARMETSDAVWVGRWLQCHTPPSTRIAYDHMSYVPPYFRHVMPTWGGTLAWLAAADPDIVIVNSIISARYGADDRAGSAYYTALVDGRAGFDRVLSRGTLAVYTRRGRITGVEDAAASLDGCLSAAAAQ
ncbi:MAG: hypothetical protein JWL71_544 [Acidobacteria bacterium]|nr:hypothetical protein [Acidobacteriota bacterium]